MANALYSTTKEGFLGADIDWADAVIKAALVRGYTYSAAHQFMSDVTGAGGGTVVATSSALTSKTKASGVADAATTTFSSVAAGASIPAVILFQSSAVGGGADVADTAQRLIAYLDTGTGLPVTPNGNDIVVAWDTGANRIFKL